MKEKYGSRSAWQEAKSKAQSHQAGNGSATQNGQALNNEHSPKANDVGNNAKPASSASKPTPEELGMKYKDENYYKAIGVQTHAAKARENMEQNTAAARNSKPQMSEPEAYRQYLSDFKDMREQTGSTAQRKVDQSAHYGHLMGTKGSYGGSQAHQNAVEQLMSTGQKFSSLDVQREMGSASTHDMKGLYKAYGGSENYFANHGVGSGNFLGDDTLGTMKGADDLQRQYFADRTGFYNDANINEKYGGYSFFQDRKSKVLAQADKWNKTFDDRENRMNESGYGSVYGF